MGRFYKALGPLKNKLFIDGVEQNVYGKTVTLTKSGISGLQTSNNGFHSYNTCCVEYNGKLHFFGSLDDGNNYRGVHTDFDGTTWTEHDESELPKDKKNNYLSFGHTRAVVLDNEIHVLGCYFQSNKSKIKHSLHYKWNPTNGWTKVGNMPYNCIDSDAIVFENQIHLFGGSASKSTMKLHKVYNGKKWKSLKNLPYFFKNVYSGLSRVIVYEDDIFVLFTKNDNGRMPKFSYVGKNGDTVIEYDNGYDRFLDYYNKLINATSCHIFKNPVSEILSLDATDLTYTNLEIKRKTSEKESRDKMGTFCEWYFELIMSVVNPTNSEPINTIITYFNDTLYICKYGITLTTKEIYKIDIK